MGRGRIGVAVLRTRDSLLSAALNFLIGFPTVAVVEFALAAVVYEDELAREDTLDTEPATEERDEAGRLGVKGTWRVAGLSGVDVGAIVV